MPWALGQNAARKNNEDHGPAARFITHRRDSSGDAPETSELDGRGVRERGAEKTICGHDARDDRRGKTPLMRQGQAPAHREPDMIQFVCYMQWDHSALDHALPYIIHFEFTDGRVSAFSYN